MVQSLSDKQVGILLASGFEETHMTEPQRVLTKAGAQVFLVSPEHKLVNSWHGKTWGHFFPIDRPISAVLGSDLDMVILPGGQRSLMTLSHNLHTRRIVGHFLDAHKPIAAIAEGVQILTLTQNLQGRKVTGLLSSKSLIESVGGQWQDNPVVIDDMIVTAKGSDHLEPFIEAMMDTLTTASVRYQRVISA